jgi:hypothetical protein
MRSKALAATDGELCFSFGDLVGVGTICELGCLGRSGAIASAIAIAIAFFDHG